jgi:hypothetical protein
LKALYLKGFVDGKPMSKMLVDGGAFDACKLSKGLKDLIETNMMLKDFRGNVSWNRPNYKSTSTKTITEVIKFSHLSPYNSGSPMK